MMFRRKWSILLLFLLPLLTTSAFKALSQNCFCDVSTSCDQQCCCDGDCSATVTTYWSDYNLCANDGFTIPFCSSQLNTALHIHDLSEGLRLIYTVVKRMFCISRVNFVTPSVEYKTTSTDQQIPAAAGVESATNPFVLGLAADATVVALPMRDSVGGCAAFALRDMNNVRDGRCRVNVASTAAIATNGMLNPSTFAANNGLDPAQLRVFRTSSTSLTPAGVANAVTLVACAPVGTTSSCQTIKLIKLFFVKGTTTTIDYASSYLVLGQTYVNPPTNIYIEYSYQFMASATSFPFAASQGYTIGSPLNLLLSTTVGVTTTDTKIFNPLNLAFRKEDGTCRTLASDSADGSNLASLKFGVNTIFSCVGTTSSFWSSNLINAFNYVGSFGISSNNIADYIAVTQNTIQSNENMHLLVDYIPIGTELDPQYQILQVRLQPASTISTEVYLFVEFQAVSTGVFLNVPPPPKIDIRLPNDFLYPFYVA